MKQKLLILSITALFGCQTNNSETEEITPVNPVVELFGQVLKENIDLSNSVNDLLVRIDTTDNDICALGIENKIDPGKILFIGSEKKLFTPFIEELNDKIGTPNSFGTYSVWLHQNLEFSLFPNPTEKWIFMIRKR